MKIKCELCGKEFEYDKLSVCRAQLTRHLSTAHNMKLEDYLVKTQFNGVHPVCACGCGRPVHITDHWRWHVYATDTCYGRLVKLGNNEVRKHFDETHIRKFDLKEYYKRNYDEESYRKAFTLFKSKEWPLSKVASEFKIDKRTLKQVWVCLEIATVEEIQELVNYYQYNFPTITKGYTDVSERNDLVWIYKVIKAHPGKYTINSIIDYYNERHDEKLSLEPRTTYKNLIKLYGDEIDVLLSFGYHSTDEFLFYQTLCFYFPGLKSKIELGRKFIIEDTYLIYDIAIGNTILIEYDASGKYHQEKTVKKRDKLKEDFALNNGYKFLRLSKEDIFNPETITKIKNILENK